MPGIARRPAEKLPPASATLGHHARSTIEQLTDLSTTSRDITAPIATVNRPTELITHTAERAIGNLRRRSTRNHPSPCRDATPPPSDALYGPRSRQLRHPEPAQPHDPPALPE